MLPTIKVDGIKCKNAIACRKCLLICPTQVFSLTCDEPQLKFRETDTAFYKIKAVHLLACTLCMECVKACPEQAIEISFSESNTDERT